MEQKEAQYDEPNIEIKEPWTLGNEALVCSNWSGNCDFDDWDSTSNECTLGFFIFL